jgi:4-amino-4-deoxy-L-arabinose transferase-like glycosyltransferase
VRSLLSKANGLLDDTVRGLRRAHPPSLVVAALLLGTLAQTSLAPIPGLVAGCLLVLGFLLLVSSYLEHARHSPQSDAVTNAILLVALIGGGLVFTILSTFRAAIPLYTAAVILFVLGTSSKFETDLHKPERFTAKEIAILLGIVALGFVLMGYRVAAIPPGFHGDEGESGMQSLSLLHGEAGSLISVGWYHLPMLGFAWHAVSMKVFGETVFGLRMSSVLVGTLTLVPTYLLTRLLFNRKTALLATFLLAVSHSFIALNRLGINYTQTTLFEVTAFYFLFRGLRSKRWRDFAVSGLLVGGGLYLYYASRLVPFIILGFVACASLSNRRFLRDQWRGLVVLTLTAVIVFSPMGLYFVQHPWHFMSRTSNVFVLGDRGWVNTPYPPDSSALTILRQAARVLPLFNYGGDSSGQYGYRGPMLDFITSILFVLGLGYSFARVHRPHHLFLLIWFWATMIVGGVLTLPAPFLPRLAGMLPVLSIFAAATVSAILGVFEHAWGQRKATRATLAGLVALTLGVVAFLNYDAYFNKYIHTIQGWAMREPATAIARYVNSLGENYEVYLLGAPKLYVRHGTIRFIARNMRGTDVLSPSQYIPLQTGGENNVVYVLLPSHLHHLSDLQQYYPKGMIRNFTRESGELWFTTFEVDKEDIAAAAIVPPTSP